MELQIIRFNEAIQHIKETIGTPQYEIAKDLLITPGALSDIIRGKVIHVSKRVAYMLEEKYKISMKYILEGDGELLLSEEEIKKKESEKEKTKKEDDSELAYDREGIKFRINEALDLIKSQFNFKTDFDLGNALETTPRDLLDLTEGRITRKTLDALKDKFKISDEYILYGWGDLIYDPIKRKEEKELREFIQSFQKKNFGIDILQSLRKIPETELEFILNFFKKFEK